MTTLAKHLKIIPKFASKSERNVWFGSSGAAMLLGIWFAVTLFRFLSDPSPFELGPTSRIPAFWLLAAIGFCLGGGTGAYLGLCRLKRTSKHSRNSQ